MRGAKQRMLDALRAVVVGVPFIVLIGIGGYGQGHRSFETAGEAAGAPIFATIIVAIVAASWRRRLRWGELALLIFVLAALFYRAAR